MDFYSLWHLSLEVWEMEHSMLYQFFTIWQQRSNDGGGNAFPTFPVAFPAFPVVFPCILSNVFHFQITNHICIYDMSVQSDREEMLEHFRNFHGISREFPCISRFYLHTDNTKWSFCSKQDIPSHLWLGYIDIIQLDFSISVLQRSPGIC